MGKRHEETKYEREREREREKESERERREFALLNYLDEKG